MRSVEVCPLNAPKHGEVDTETSTRRMRRSRTPRGPNDLSIGGPYRWKACPSLRLHSGTRWLRILAGWVYCRYGAGRNSSSISTGARTRTFTRVTRHLPADRRQEQPDHEADRGVREPGAAVVSAGADLVGVRQEARARTVAPAHLCMTPWSIATSLPRQPASPG